jgi:hypothetical protein
MADAAIFNLPWLNYIFHLGIYFWFTLLFFVAVALTIHTKFLFMYQATGIFLLLMGTCYMSRKEIEENSPSRKDGIDLKKETSLRKSYCTFLKDLGIRLKLWVRCYLLLTITCLSYIFIMCVEFSLIEKYQYHVVGIRLEVFILIVIAYRCRPQITIATAVLFCQRFFLRQSLAKNDHRVGCCAFKLILCKHFTSQIV